MCRFNARQWKNCATCQFWIGPRTLDQLQQAAEADQMAQGSCALQKRPLRKYATNSCIGWRKWAALGP